MTTFYVQSHSNSDMLAANNLTELFDYLFPIISKKLGTKVKDIIDKQNSTGNTPLRKLDIKIDYAVITNSKEMATRLV